MTWLPDGRATVHPLVLTAPPTDDAGNPLGDPTLQPDTTRTVEVFQLRPDTITAFLDWTGGGELFVNGGTAVLLPGRAAAKSRIVGLGDFAARDGDTVTAELADGFWQRWAQVATSDA